MAHWQFMPGPYGDLSDFASELIGGGGGGGGLTVPDTWKDRTNGSAAARPSPTTAAALSAFMEVPDMTPTVPSWPSTVDAGVLCEAVSADWEDATVPSWSTSDARVSGAAWAPVGSLDDGGGGMSKCARGPDAAATLPWSEAEHPWGPTQMPWYSIDGLAGALWGAPSAASDGGVIKAARVGIPTRAWSPAPTIPSPPTELWAPGVNARGSGVPSAPPHAVVADMDLPTVPEEDDGAAAAASTTAFDGRAHAAPLVGRYGDSAVDAVVAAAAADAAAAAGTAAAAAARGIAVAATSDAAAGAAIASVAVERMAAGAPAATTTNMAAATPIAAATPRSLPSSPIKPWETQLYPPGVPLQLARRAVAAVAAAGLARPYRPPPKPVADTAAAFASPWRQLSLPPPPPSGRAQAVGFLLPPPCTAGGAPWPVAPTAVVPSTPPSVAAAACSSAVALPVARRRVAKARRLCNGRFARLT